MNKKTLSIFEKLGWNYKEYEDYAEISKYTDAGEDFNFTVDIHKNIEDLAREIYEYYQDFDVLEHAKMCEETSGSPDLETLIEDAKQIEKDLESLEYSLRTGKAIDLYSPKKIKCFSITPTIQVKKKKIGYVLEIKVNNKVIDSWSALMTMDEVQKYIQRFFEHYFDGFYGNI